jgi:hypothetical protein
MMPSPDSLPALPLARVLGALPLGDRARLAAVSKAHRAAVRDYHAANPARGVARGSDDVVFEYIRRLDRLTPDRAAWAALATRLNAHADATGVRVSPQGYRVSCDDDDVNRLLGFPTAEWGDGRLRVGIHGNMFERRERADAADAWDVNRHAYESGWAGAAGAAALPSVARRMRHAFPDAPLRLRLTTRYLRVANNGALVPVPPEVALALVTGTLLCRLFTLL